MTRLLLGVTEMRSASLRATTAMRRWNTPENSPAIVAALILLLAITAEGCPLAFCPLFSLDSICSEAATSSQAKLITVAEVACVEPTVYTRSTKHLIVSPSQPAAEEWFNAHRFHVRPFSHCA